jgi:hypothetical protein
LCSRRLKPFRPPFSLASSASVARSARRRSNSTIFCFEQENAFISACLNVAREGRAPPPCMKSPRHEAKPYLRERQTPPRSWSWSDQSASKAPLAPGPPRCDLANRREPRGRRVVHRSS